MTFSHKSDAAIADRGRVMNVKLVLDEKLDEPYMRRCIELAQQAKLQGNTPVGSIVVLNDDIIGEGVEGLPAGNNITSHAEILACQAAGIRMGNRKLTGSTLYTVAEPCFMCSYVIRECDISRVVFGLETPVIGGITSAHPILTDPFSTWSPPPEIRRGVLRSECLQLRHST